MDSATFIARTKAHWLRIIHLVDSGRIKPAKVSLLKQEGAEILAMVVASIRTAKARR